MSLKRVWIGLCSMCMNFPMSGYSRSRWASWMGVRMNIPQRERRAVFIGEGVRFDNLHPEKIEIGNWTTLATGCIILTHYVDTSRTPPGYFFRSGPVKIGYDCFVGANVIICNSCSIGDHSIVAAGSVITKDIPPCEIWGGVPAKFIKKRNVTKPNKKE